MKRVAAAVLTALALIGMAAASASAAPQNPKYGANWGEHRTRLLLHRR